MPVVLRARRTGGGRGACEAGQRAARGAVPADSGWNAWAPGGWRRVIGCMSRRRDPVCAAAHQAVWWVAIHPLCKDGSACRRADVGVSVRMPLGRDPSLVRDDSRTAARSRGPTSGSMPIPCAVAYLLAHRGAITPSIHWTASSRCSPKRRQVLSRRGAVLPSLSADGGRTPDVPIAALIAELWWGRAPARDRGLGPLRPSQWRWLDAKGSGLRWPIHSNFDEGC